MKLSKQIKENKKLYNYIQNKITSNKNLYMGKGTNVKLILRNRKKVLNEFISRNKGLQTEYNDLKTENQAFSNTYKNILMYRDNQAYLEKRFKDNLLLYQKNGYKIPNLTTKSNIIKYSPLLMEGQDHINKYFLQDLYILNKDLNKIYSYDKLQKYIIENDVNFNGNSEEEDDDNDKEGINSIFFLNKCDLLAKKAYKDKKGKRIYKSLDINNWFKQDLYADPFLTQGNYIYEDFSFDSCVNNKSYLLNKEIEKLIAGNNKIKESISKMNNFNLNKNYDIKKRHSVLELKLKKNNKYILPINNINTVDMANNELYKRNKVKKLTLPHKSKKDIKFEEFYNDIIFNKNKKKNKTKITNKLLIIDSKDSIKSLKVLKKPKSLKKCLDLKGNSFKAKTKIYNSVDERNNKNNKINIKNKTMNFFGNIKDNNKLYEKKFKLYSGKEPRYLFSLINDGKEPFNRANIINIFSKKFKISQLNDLKMRYSFLEKYLSQGLIERDFSI